MIRLLKEPLLHFLILALGLFWLYGVLNPDPGNERAKVVTVDREAMLQFLQYRNRSFARARFEAVLERMPAEELERLIDEYVREEVLFREAKAAQLDRHDYVARMRLVQQFEYLTRSSILQPFELSEAEREAYYSAHKTEYFVDPTVTFTHVFIGRRGRPDEEVKRAALALGRELNEHNVGFTQAAAYGERFPYHVNYVSKSRGELSGHFGEEMTAQLMELAQQPQVWQGPLASPHGYHWVLLTRRTEGYQPPLEEIRHRLAADAQQAALRSQHEEAIERIIRNYRIVRQLGRAKPVGG